jgi:uncharacterized repeat protein (TIGR01451 family)
LIDDDLNTDPGTAESLVLRTTNATTGEFEDRTYIETGVDSGVFTSTVATLLGVGAGPDNDGVFNVQVGDALTTLYNDARTACGTMGSASATTNVAGPALTLTKTASVATAVPGEIISYRVVHTNDGTVSVLPSETVDPVPLNTDFQVGSASFSTGTSGITAVIEFSNNGGATYTHIPVSGGGGAPPGFDRDVTHIRYTYVGTLVTTSPDNTFDVDFSVRVR